MRLSKPETCEGCGNLIAWTYLVPDGMGGKWHDWCAQERTPSEKEVEDHARTLADQQNRVAFQDEYDAKIARLTAELEQERARCVELAEALRLTQEYVIWRRINGG